MSITKEEIVHIIKDNSGKGWINTEIVADEILFKMKDREAQDYGTVTLMWLDGYRRTIPIRQSVKGMVHNVVTFDGITISSRYHSYYINFNSDFEFTELNAAALKQLMKWLRLLNDGLGV